MLRLPLPIHCRSQNRPQHSERAVDAAHLESFGLSVSSEVGYGFAGDIAEFAMRQGFVSTNGPESDPIPIQPRLGRVFLKSSPSPWLEAIVDKFPERRRGLLFSNADFALC